MSNLDVRIVGEEREGSGEKKQNRDVRMRRVLAGAIELLMVVKSNVL